MEDTEIIALLVQRSESGLDEIIRRYGKMLKSFAAHILPTVQDAEECMNDALLDIWNTIPPKQPYSLASYAITLTRCRAVDKLRHMTAKKRGGGAYLVALHELKDCIPGGASFDEDAEALKDAINSFLAALSAEDRMLFVGRYFALEPLEALAERNKVTKNTVNIRLSRMRKKLEYHLEERGIFI